MATPRKRNSTRLKQLFLTERELLGLLNWKRETWIEMPVFDGIPEDVEVVGIHSDPYRGNELIITIEHPSFQEVPAGSLIPTIPAADRPRIASRRLSRLTPGGGSEEVHVVSVETTPYYDLKRAAEFINPAPATKKPWEFLGPPR